MVGGKLFLEKSQDTLSSDLFTIECALVKSDRINYDLPWALIE